MKRFANANWQGSGKEGKGLLTTQMSVLNNTPYSYHTRFEDGENGTNPEELLAAAHAGCFTMKLSFNIDAAGFKASNIDTRCIISLENGSITKSHLTIKAKVPGITPEKFEELVLDAEKNCPVSKLFNAEISHEAQLVKAE
ncbi:MAG TPA: OsmC family protein [Bacteroidales bacterium]|nr:OsmC family protein [Bacteroidales bacterium]